MKKRTTSRSRKSSKKSNTAAYVLAGIGVIAIIAIIVALILLFAKPRDGVLATVNGEAITQEELEFQYNLLPEEYRSTFTEEQVLEQIIDETLVVQAAQREGIAVSDEEVLERVQAILAANEITIADLQANLAQFNVTQEEFEALIERQLLLDRYLDRTLVLGPPDEATLEGLYNLSTEKFTIPEQVSVRHVLIASQRDDAALIAKDIYEQAQAGADFCDLAANASDDRGSRDTCGEYTFPRGFMDPVFEGAAFTMADGEVRLIQTRFGYHVIKRLNMTPASVQAYDEVRDELVAEYQATQRAVEYRKLLNNLRASATIEYANGTKVMPQQPSAIAPAAPPEPTVPEPVPEPTSPEPTPEPAAPAAPSGPAEQVAPEPTPEPTPEPAAPPEPAPQTGYDGELFSCIAARATLYGTSWSSDTQEARQLFERQGVSLNYVECNTGGACAGITAYPTWSIAGEQYLGRMSVEQLKNAANC